MTKNHENSPNITPVSGKKKSSDIVEATPILTEDTLSIDLSIDNIYLEDLPLNDLHLDDEAFSSMESIESMDSIEPTFGCHEGTP
jgi:hypothetical protein